jgi:hypothetical protein
MAARGRERIGWGVLIVSLAGLAAYMASVGWNQANMIAGIGGFFVAVGGLALALAERHSATVEERGQIRQRIRDVHANSVTQDALAPSGRASPRTWHGLQRRQAGVELSFHRG